MKTAGCRVWVGLIFLISFHAQAQLSTGSLRTLTETNQPTEAQLAGRAGQWRVKQRSAHETEWYSVRYRTNTGTGKVTASTNSYVELATGLNRFEAASGKWVESKEEIEIVPGGAVARKGQHQVAFAANINTAGAIQTTAPDGKVLRSHVLGLAYTDAATGESVLIAELRDSIGEVVGNQVIYRDAFDGPFRADLRYTYTKAGFEQDVIFRESPPVPEKFGLNSEIARLEVWTEFLSPPAPVKSVSVLKVETNNLVRSVMVDPDLSDETLDFGAMRIGTGTAFSLEEGAHGLDNPAIPVGKDWLRLEGRDFLIEKVDYEDAHPSLEKLPAAVETVPVDGGKRASRPAQPRSELLAAMRPPSAQVDRAEAVTKPMRMAAALPPERGFVLDYSQTSSQSNMVFRSDTTYYVSSVVNLTGTTKIEGGTVVKYASGLTGYLNIQGPLICSTEPYRPAFFTAKDDNSVGETISGSTGVPSGSYGQYNLRLNDTAATNHYSIRHLRLRYAHTGILRMGGSASTTLTVEHTQIQDCSRAITSYTAPLYLRNVLIYRALTGIYPSLSIPVIGENVTFHRLGSLHAGASMPAMQLKNTLIISCTNYVSYVSDPTVINMLSDAGVFQSTGSGAHYLATGSPYRMIGTTTVNSNLLQALKATTTVPPEILSGTISQDRVLNPLVVRNSATAPDLGYAYDAIDYLAQNLTVQGAAAPAVTMTLKNGVVVGVNPLSGQTGIQFGNYSDLISVGEPGNWNRIIPMQMVQENGTASSAWPGFFRVLHGAGLGNYPNASFRFTDFSIPAGPYQLMACWNGGFIKLAFQDSQVRGGTLYLGSDSPSQSIGLTNTYWERVSYYHHPYAPGAFHVRNNLFKGGSLYLDMNPAGAPVWTFYDNLFDGTLISQTGGPAVENNFNAYVHTAQNTNRLSPAVAVPNNRDVILAASPTLEAGPFGSNYLQGAPASLVNKGSRGASEAGLYHYTTAKDLQTIEGATVVDIGLHYVAATAGNGLSDTDTDGFVDYQEDANGNGMRDNAETDFTKADTDSDGLSDYQEIVALQGLVNPLLFDTDGDGLSDADEDSDRDLLSNIAELNTYITDPVDPHSLIREISPAPENYPLILAAGQNGGLQTDSHSLMAAQAGELGYVAELSNGSLQNGLIHFTLTASGSISPSATFDIYVSDNVINTDHNRFHFKGTSGQRVYDVPVPTGPNGQFSAGSANDTDGDGLTDGFEALVSRTPINLPEPDTDGDGLPDAFEIAVTGTDPNNPDSGNNGVGDGYKDTDGDGWTNLDEMRNKTSPSGWTPPPAPNGLRAIEQTGGTITLSWEPAHGSVVEYNVFRAIGASYNDSPGIRYVLSGTESQVAQTTATTTQVPGPWNIHDSYFLGQDVDCYAVEAVYASGPSVRTPWVIPHDKSLTFGAKAVRGPGGFVYLAFSGLPEGVNQIEATWNAYRFDPVSWIGFYDTYASFNIQRSSLVNGVYQVPLPDTHPYDPISGSEYPNGELFIRVGDSASGFKILPIHAGPYFMHDPSSRYLPFVDGSVHLKQNLSFYLRTAPGPSSSQGQTTPSGSFRYFSKIGFSDPTKTTCVYPYNTLFHNHRTSWDEFEFTEPMYESSGLYYSKNVPEGSAYPAHQFDPFAAWKENYMLRNFAYESGDYSSSSRHFGRDVRWDDGWSPDEGCFDNIFVVKSTRFLFDVNQYSYGSSPLPVLGEAATQWFYRSSSAFQRFGAVLNSDNSWTLPTNAKNGFGLSVKSIRIPISSNLGRIINSGETRTGIGAPPLATVGFPEVESPTLKTVGYYFLGLPLIGYLYTPTLINEGTISSMIPGTSDFNINTTTRLLVGEVGQPLVFAGYAKQSIENGDPNKFAYLGQYFDKAYKADANGNATTTETGILSEYGEFFPTEPGLTILKTKHDPDQVGSPGGPVGEAKVHVLKIQLDVNHDGNMNLTFAGPDNTTPERPFVFWQNNDVDRFHEVDCESCNLNCQNCQNCDSEFDDLQFTDIPPNQPRRVDHDYLAYNFVTGQYDAPGIPCSRDLEDYARLWLPGLSTLRAQMPVGYKASLRMVGDAEIRLFRAVESGGGNGYLTDEAAANNQVNQSRDLYLGRVSSENQIEFDSQTPMTDHFIFCGARRGTGTVTLRVEDANGNVIAETSAYIEIKDIKEMYERYTVGDSTEGGNPVSLKVERASEDLPLGVNLPFRYSFNGSSDSTSPYILFVHGWNMERWEKDRFAETAYKRLYWQGYVGRFGSFRWPTRDKFGGKCKWADYSDAAKYPQHYDQSEHNAWKAAGRLRDLLTTLNSQYLGKVHLLAHSMGNVVAGEALRLAGNQRLVNTYVASQAAIPAHVYDGGINNMNTPGSMLPFVYNHPSGWVPNLPYGPQTPNIYGNWMNANSTPATRRINFYNPADFALANESWGWNQLMKPDQGIGAGWRYSGFPNDGTPHYVEGGIDDVPPWDHFFFVVNGLTLPAPISNYRYDIMAFAAEARSRPLGALAVNSLTINVDLGNAIPTIWPPDPDPDPTRGAYGAHKWHSAQFRSTNMRQRGYWRALLSNPGFGVQ